MNVSCISPWYIVCTYMHNYTVLRSILFSCWGVACSVCLSVDSVFWTAAQNISIQIGTIIFMASTLSPSEYCFLSINALSFEPLTLCYASTMNIISYLCVYLCTKQLISFLTDREPHWIAWNCLWVQLWMLSVHLFVCLWTLYIFWTTIPRNSTLFTDR